MQIGVIAGFFYFLIVGTAGVVLGTLREIFLTPMIGRSFAIGLELPVMLLIAWYGCRLIVKLTKIPEENIPRFVMGVFCFGLLIGMEQSLQFAIKMLLQGGKDAAPWIAADYIGLAGQIATAFFPMFIVADTVEET
jgi:hypothetical protein